MITANGRQGSARLTGAEPRSTDDHILRDRPIGHQWGRGLPKRKMTLQTPQTRRNREGTEKFVSLLLTYLNAADNNFREILMY